MACTCVSIGDWAAPSDSNSHGHSLAVEFYRDLQAYLLPLTTIQSLNGPLGLLNTTMSSSAALKPHISFIPTTHEFSFFPF